MSDINWDDNARAAVKEFYEWSCVDNGLLNEFMKTIATRPEPNFKATRENLEKIAKDAKCDFVEVGEPKWTHILGGRKCKIIINEPDVDEDIVVLCEGGDYQIVGYDQLKPIKPTITKDLAWDLIVDGCTVEWITSKYEVVE